MSLASAGAEDRRTGDGVAAAAVIAVALAGSVGAILVVGNTPRPFLPPVPVSPVGAALPLLLAYGVGMMVAARFRRWNGPAVFTAAFALRVAVSVLLAYAAQGQDEQILHRHAEAVSRCLPGCGLQMLVQGEDGYPAVVAALYAAFGPNLLLPKILNAALGALLPLLAADVAAAILPESRAPRRALYFAAFLPPLVLYAGMNLKEVPVAFLLVLAIWVVLVPRAPLTLRAGWGLLVVIVTYALRAAWAIFPFLAVTVLLVGARGVCARDVLRVRPLVVAAALALALLFPLRGVVDRALAHAQTRLLIGTYAAWSTLQQTQGSATRALLDIDRPWTLRNLAVQVARAPFSPSPATFLVPDARTVQGAIDSLVGATQVALFPFAVIGVLAFRRRSGVLALALAGGALLVTVGLSLMLGLTISRHAVPQFAVLYVLAALGVERWPRYRLLLEAWAVAAVAYVFVYVLTRA